MSEDPTDMHVLCLKVTAGFFLFVAPICCCQLYHVGMSDGPTDMHVLYLKVDAAYNRVPCFLQAHSMSHHVLT
jgi:hypothetical protein